MSSRAFNAFTAEPWAIEPSWLPLLAAIAQRNQSAPEVEAALGWVKRDHLLMAGPGAQRLAGAQRAYVVDGTAVLPITGPIFPRANMLTEISGATSLAVTANDYNVALAARDVRSIMLLIDSPGGAVSGVAAFAAAVASGTRRKETTAYVSGLAASAAYWIASAASRISVDRTAMLGSIGVVAAVPKQVAADQDGVIQIEIVSSNAPNKRPDPETADGQSTVRAYLDSLERVFVTDVARGRKVPTSKVVTDFGRGGVMIGSAAIAAGMADRVTTQAEELRLISLAPHRGPSAGMVTQDQRNRQRLTMLRLRKAR